MLAIMSGIAEGSIAGQRDTGQCVISIKSFYLPFISQSVLLSCYDSHGNSELGDKYELKSH